MESNSNMTHNPTHNPIHNPIQDAGAIKALVINLYTGWGYNAYRRENQDRADDQILRNGICGLLGDARHALGERVAEIRRTIPRPSRETPFPGEEQRAAIADIERTGQRIEALEALIRHLPVPEDDATWRRHRAEREMLPLLTAADEALTSLAVWVLAAASVSGLKSTELDAALASLQDAMVQRQQILTAAGP